MTKYLSDDGWDYENISPLDQVESEITNLEKVAYELRNAVRTKSLVEMRDDIRGYIDSISDALDCIGDEDEVYEEKEEYPGPDLQCHFCKEDLLDNPDIEEKGQPAFICSDDECDKENRQVG